MLKRFIVAWAFIFATLTLTGHFACRVIIPGPTISFERFYCTSMPMADQQLQPLAVNQDSGEGIRFPLIRRAEYRRQICRSYIITTCSVESPACSYVAVYKFFEYVWMNAVIFYSEQVLHHVTYHNMFIIQSVATCSALAWLLFRAWQTLRIPVPQLINILGINVPDPPEVFLAGIRSDAITLHWSRSEPHKSVVKYFIQINGVNVGETSRLETVITVTGLRPGHFYNIRVIAVGSNNFQTGSTVIRLRTYGKDGRPILGIERKLPADLASDDNSTDSGDEISNRNHSVCVEATVLPEDLQDMNLDTTVSTTSCTAASVTGVKIIGQWGNMEGASNERKHSSSLAYSEPVSSLQVAKEEKETIHRLTEQLDMINHEREKMAYKMAREAEDFKIQLANLCCEKIAKKKALKEKEEASEKLKKEVNHAERLNRQAQTRKSQKEKLLKEKIAERSKMEEDMKRWKKEIEEMKVEKERWRREKEKSEKRKQIKAAEIKEEIKIRQAVLNSIEEDIRVKGSQIKQLEKHRQRLPGSRNNEESRLRDENEDREWEITEKVMTAELNSKSQQLREIGAQLHQQQAYLTTLQQRNTAIYRGNSSGINFERPTCESSNAKSCGTPNQNNQKISPILRHIAADSLFGSSNSPSSTSPAYVPGPYLDIIGESSAAPITDSLICMTDEDYSSLSAGAPMSPTATSLLPSNIFADDDTLSPNSGSIDLASFSLQTQVDSYNDHDSNPQCQSPGLMSSPQSLPHSIPFHGISGCDYIENDPLLNSSNPSFGPIGSAVLIKQGANKGFRDLFSLPKPRSKDTDPDGPALGSLKSNQSHSFPRIIEEADVFSNRHRRISFPSGWTGFLHNKTSSNSEPPVNVNIPSSPSNSNARRHKLGTIGSGLDDSNLMEINPPSPRPISIASSDLPRPSTDSAPFGWGPALDNNRNSPLANNWSLRGSKLVSVQQQTAWPSNSSTRRANSRYEIFPSRVVSDDIEPSSLSESIKENSRKQSKVSSVGTQPSSSHQKTSAPKLNPAAPAFQGFKPNIKYEKEDESSEEKIVQSFDPIETSDIALTQPNLILDSASLKSSDSPSIENQNICLEIHEILERQSSETFSEFETNVSCKDKEGTSLQRLFRKGSSSKFIISPFRSKDSSLFNSKKSGSNAGHSDRNASVERESSFEESIEIAPNKSSDVISSNPAISWNNPAEGKPGKNKDPSNLKERKLSKSWGRFGLRGRKGRESLETDRSEDGTVTENDA